jgi:hypothetical protein
MQRFDRETQVNETTRQNGGKCVDNNKMNFREIECGYFYRYYEKFPALSVFYKIKKKALCCDRGLAICVSLVPAR